MILLIIEERLILVVCCRFLLGAKTFRSDMVVVSRRCRTIGFSMSSTVRPKIFPNVPRLLLKDNFLRRDLHFLNFERTQYFIAFGLNLRILNLFHNTFTVVRLHHEPKTNTKRKPNNQRYQNSKIQREVTKDHQKRRGKKKKTQEQSQKTRDSTKSK